MNTEHYHFAYAIVNSKGEFYTGRTFDHPQVWAKSKADAFTYSERGAYAKIALFPFAFNGCYVLRVL